MLQDRQFDAIIKDLGSEDPLVREAASGYLTNW